MQTKVHFRKFPDGEVLAMFPEIPATTNPSHCLSYAHNGQHGAASVDAKEFTRPATPEEAEPLAAELRSLGYDLAPVSRITLAMDRKRVAALHS